MQVDYVQFCVENATTWRQWFEQVLGYRSIASQIQADTHTEIMGDRQGCFWLSAPLSSQSPVACYLEQHPPGVADLAFCVDDLAAAVQQAAAAGAKVLQPIQAGPQGRWAQVQGWGDLRHSLREAAPLTAASPPLWSRPDSWFRGIDHAVLNVAAGQLEAAVAWYEAAFGFQRQQRFQIQTARSGLCSQVLWHPQGSAQLPINQPASPDSQIQEFLDHHRGAGIQHIALKTPNIIETIAQLRDRGLQFLSVPSSYYSQLPLRPGCPLSAAEQQAIAQQEILVDWQADRPEALLLQAFTQPIFGQPTFFFELIERRSYWQNQQWAIAQGFGEGNFQALFEAMEREQIKRGSLR